MKKLTVQDINNYVGTTVNPLNSPDTIYELYSVPSFDSDYPEVLHGSEIGSSKVTIEENDVLVCKINPRINRVWIVKHHTKHQLIASSEWVIIRSPENNPRYLMYYFQSPTFRTYINSGLTGIGGSLTRAQPKQIAKYPVPLPSIELQDRIAATLDKLQSIITHRKQQLKKLDELVKARFVEMFGEPIDNPMRWQVKPLKDLSVLITNGNTPKGGSENYVDSGIIFLRSQNVWRNRIDLSDVAYIDDVTHQKMRKSSVKHKDILITKTGRINTENSSLGRAALYLGEDDSANINGHVYLVRLNDAVVPEFVVTILTGEAYRKYIRKVCVGGIDKRQINLDQVEDFPIILPPI